MLNMITTGFRRKFARMHCPPGAVPLEMGGRFYFLRFDYQALDLLQREQGVSDLTKLMIKPDRESLERMLLIGLRRHHGESVTAAQVARHSPPIAVCIRVISEALNFAYWGPDGPPADPATAAANEG